MEHKKLTFAPQTRQAGSAMKRDPLMHPLQGQISMRQDSVALSQLSFNMGGNNRRDSSDGILDRAGPRKNSATASDKQFAASSYKCLFHTRWRLLAYLQLIVGLVTMAVNMYSK
ncbi:hypothetical protein RvY_00470-2 [Ramazzottius varieornatus]|uniref:Uncharacterized protein n=1 Tax=Ramazzottius varieornatus TaxID=947166 RepID=A0A1D1UGZ2_RAMVA|nr:hypothetical protein RvY_00470-2 [Ramazzottius varieornatus]